MKKVLITGGSGSIGKAFIKEYYDDYIFYNISRSEDKQSSLSKEFPEVINYIGSIEDICFLYHVFEKVKPNIVLHMAAMKHINIAEVNTIQCCNINIVGSLNVISASKKYNVPITIGISTDKACLPESTYGYTKYLMEKCFIEANTTKNKFALCRFANVAHSSGSVIPLWLKAKEENRPLKLTDPRMNRLIFSLKDSAKFIHRTIDICNNIGGAFIGVNVGMKVINMFELAKCISDNVEIIGKITEAEKFDEDLISERELPYTYVMNDSYVIIHTYENTFVTTRLKEKYGSHNAVKITHEELMELIEEE